MRSRWLIAAGAFLIVGGAMSTRMSAAIIGAALLALYSGLALIMRSMGSEMPYLTDLLPSGWRAGL